MKKPAPINQPALSAKDLFDLQVDSLKLAWRGGKDGSDKQLEPATAKYPGLALVGHLNFIHPNRVQIIGTNEIRYLDNLDSQEREAALGKLFSCETTTIVICAGVDAPEDIVKGADKFQLPLFQTPIPSPVTIEHLQYFLTRQLAPRLTVHGVYMEVMGMGVFIAGESGIGKSELALELLSRNHRLIADDAVEFMRVGPDVLVGQCPRALIDFMEVRGLGIINVRDMFGETAVRHKKKLHLIVQLKQLDSENPGDIDRLQAKQMTHTMLDVEIPEIVLYVAPGRNLAILVEAATRTYILRMWGIDAYDEFARRQQRLIDQDGK